jgi:hypothetical protein
MVAIAAHDLKNLTETFIIRDVVSDKVGSAHKEERRYLAGPPSSLVHFTPLNLYTSLVSVNPFTYLCKRARRSRHP